MKSLTLETFKPYFEKVGNFVSDLTTKAVKFLGEQGLKVSDTASKIITLIILLILIYISIKILHSVRAVVKWGIIILLILLMISVGISLFI